MIDPNFDPLSDLEQLKAQSIQHEFQLNELGKMFEQLVKAHNAQAQLIKQITQQNTELLQLWAFNTNLPKP
jgi:hypothetical protein